MPDWYTSERPLKLVPLEPSPSARRTLILAALLMCAPLVIVFVVAWLFFGGR